jgi:hypothetical protein
MRNHLAYRRRCLAILATTLAALAIGTCADGAGSPFSAPLTIAAEGGSRPTTAIDPRDGTVYVAWVGTEAGAANVYLSRLDPGAEHPTAPVRVNDLPGDAAPHDQAPARVAVGPDGTVILVWQNNRQVPGRRFPASNLRLTRSTDRGATFEPARTINQGADGPPGSHTFHDLAIADDGAVLVSWIQSAESPGPETGHPAGHAVDHAAGHGSSHAAGSGSEIHLARSSDGGRTFPASRVVDRGACPCCRTTVAIAPDGSAFLAWRKVFQENIRDIVVARAEAPRSTGPRGAVHPPSRAHHDDWRLDACPHAGPALLVDHAGTVHLAWYTGREGGAGLYYSASTDHGATFAEPTPILTGKAIPPSQVALAASGDGTVQLAWEDRRDATRRIHLARLEQGTRLLTLAGATPALAATAGTTALAWLDGEAVRLVVAR